MKLEDYVRKSIWEYPSLYKDVDYEKSRLKVLNQVFFVLGNALELAEPKDPKKGGYYVYPKMKKVKGEWERCPDKPYGADKFPMLPEDFFKVPIYYLYQCEVEMYEVENKKYWDKSQYFRVKSNKGGDLEDDPTFKILGGLRMTEAKSNGFHPYPFSTTYGVFGDLRNGGFLQPDWMEGLIELCKVALAWYKDPSLNIEDSYHPSQSTPSDNRMFKEAEMAGVERVQGLRKTWGWPLADTIPTEAEVWEKAENIWQRFLAKQIETLENFLRDGTVIEPKKYLSNV